MKINDIINESPEIGDSIDLEFGDTLIETTITDITPDGIVVHLDETAMSMVLSARRQFISESRQGVAEGSIDQRIAQAKKNNPLRASVAKKTNGYAALVTDTTTGKPSWFGGALWQTPELAMGHAKAFVKGFPYLEQEYAQRFIDKNIDGIVEQGVAEGSDHSLKQVWDRYSKHLQAGRGDHSDIRQINKSGKILQDIRKYVKDHHGQKAVDDMERYAERRQWDEGVAEGEKKPHPQTWHDVDPKLGKQVDKMSQAEKVKKGLAHPDTLKKKGVAEEEIDEAKYQGRTVPLGKPMAGDVKKSKVYVKGPKGNVVKVNFGQKGVKIKKNNPGRRKNFRARHNCDNPGPRWKAKYWSCRAW